MERLRITLLEKHVQGLESETRRLKLENEVLLQRLKDTEERRQELVRALENLLKQIRISTLEYDFGTDFKKNGAYIAANTFLVMNK